MKKILLFPAALLLAVFACFAPVNTARAADYTLFKNYQVNIKVQENNVLDVTEKITAYFDPGSYRHGIIREIPIRQEMNIPEGTKRYNIIVSGVFVKDQKFKVNRTDNYMNIRIGDPDRYVSGEVTYTIRYLYDIGDDQTDKLDFVYYNIIGTEWNANIENASFTVTMPKEFEKEKIWAYTGRYGATDNSVDIKVNGNTIYGTVTRPLGPGEGVTIKVDLPEGYFTGERTLPPWELILYIFMGLLVAASILLFVLFGIDRKVVQTVEFYAPDHLTSAEVGYIIDGCVDNKDIVSLIIYWADKGYLQIEEETKDNIYLRKLKDLPPDARRYETAFFYGLFKGGDFVSVDSLKNTFYTTMEAVKTDLQVSFETEERRIFTKMSMKMQALVSFFTTLPIAATVFYTVYKDSMDFLTSFIFSVIALMISMPVLFSMVKLLRNWRSTTPGKRTGSFIGLTVVIGIVFIIYLFFMGGAALGFAALIATVLIAWFSVFMRKRTAKGGEWFGKILGLQSFIEKAEKDRIERLVQENPHYFYNILPFAYVLGVTEKWAKKFEDIGLHPEPPAWYRGYYGMNMFTTMMFMSTINHSLNSMSTTFVSRPAPKGGYGGGSGSGGFGGGGFSGGGFGGGGGGSW